MSTETIGGMMLRHFGTRSSNIPIQERIKNDFAEYRASVRQINKHHRHTQRKRSARKNIGTRRNRLNE